jgi:hypothetical protein
MVSAFKVAQNPSGELLIQDSSGKSLTQKDFAKVLNDLPKDPNKSIGLEIIEDPSELGQTRGFGVGCLWMDVRWEHGYVGGCVRRTGWHLNFHLKNRCNERELFNLHVIGWWDNGPQFGAYNSANNWCAQSRGTWTSIRDKFVLALGAIGIGGLAATVIANISTGVVVAVFGF